MVKIPLHWQMCIALIAGITLGVLMSDCYGYWADYINGVGTIFLNAINMIVIPLVFLSVVLGISTMSNTGSLGRIALKAFGFFLITSLLSAIVGIVVTDILRPGYGVCSSMGGDMDLVTSAPSTSEYGIMERIANIVPKNIFSAFCSGDILPIVFFSVVFGLAVVRIQKYRQDTLNGVLMSINEAVLRMTNVIIAFAPIGVFAIVMSMVGKQAGDMDTLRNNAISLIFFILVVWASLIVMGGIILPMLVGLGARVSPISHFRQIYSAMMLAFSTSSSYSALPMIMSDAKDKFGVSDNVAGFVVPMGIMFNKIGTIIYECVAIIFVSQAAGVDLSFGQQMSLIGASIITVLGAPSVPMAGVVVLAILLKAMNLPGEYVGMFMAIDILCDMPKTLLNAYSVSCGVIIVAHSEGENIRI